METLTNTTFFGLLSNSCILQTEELELSVAYKKFIRLMMEICSEKKEGITPYFVLNYTLIELEQVEELTSIHEIKTVLTIIYLHKAIKAVECALEWLLCHENQSDSPVISTDTNSEYLDYHWTGKAIDLLEIALSIHEAHSINNGEISIKAVVLMLFGLFGLKPGNFSSTYGIMRIRPGSRTLYIDRMKLAIEAKMDKDDAKELERKKHN
jgi:hypothetical protein